MKIVKCFANIELMGCAVSLRLLRIGHFFFLQLIANQKIKGVTNIPMIDLGKSKEVTAVLKLLTQFSP